MRWDRIEGTPRGGVLVQMLPRINSPFSMYSCIFAATGKLSWTTYRRDLEMLKRTFRVDALSLAGGALLLGGATVAAGAMTLPGTLPSGVTEQTTAAIVTDGAGAAKVEQ